MTCKCLKNNGGAERDRTDDLLNAMYALINRLAFHIPALNNHCNNKQNAFWHILTDTNYYSSAVDALAPHNRHEIN